MSTIILQAPLKLMRSFEKEVNRHNSDARRNKKPIPYKVDGFEYPNEAGALATMIVSSKAFENGKILDAIEDRGFQIHCS